jgi:hypothetical protein
MNPGLEPLSDHIRPRSLSNMCTDRRCPNSTDTRCVVSALIVRKCANASVVVASCTAVGLQGTRLQGTRGLVSARRANAIVPHATFGSR